MQIEIELNKEKNLKVEEQNKLVLAAAAQKTFNNDDLASRDFSYLDPLLREKSHKSQCPI